MPHIKFEHSGCNYSVDLSWDETAFTDGRVRFLLAVEKYTSQDPTMVASVKTTISIEEGESGGDLVISIGGHDAYGKSLSELYDEDVFVGQALERIPAVLFAGDPILGCLVRSGSSEVVRQIIGCKNTTTGLPWFSDRAAAIGQCLRVQTQDILLKTAYRSAKCVFWERE